MFKINPRTGIKYARCIDCHAKHFNHNQLEDYADEIMQAKKWNDEHPIRINTATLQECWSEMFRR